MGQLQSKSAMIRQGFQASLPIALGYIPVAITFGVLAMQAGMSSTDPFY